MGAVSRRDCWRELNSPTVLPRLRARTQGGRGGSFTLVARSHVTGPRGMHPCPILGAIHLVDENRMAEVYVC